MSYDQAVAIRHQTNDSASGGSKSSLVVYDEKYNRISPDSRLEGGKRKRRRFAPVEDKQYIPPPFLDLPIGLSVNDVDQFFREQRLDDLTSKISRNDLELGDPDIRPPSPPPAYDRNGARTNARETRARASMQKEYHRLVSTMIRKLPGYVAPIDYKPPKITMRVEIPHEKYPDVNFLGMILGPRGLNHKRLEEETGCSISIRGKGTKGQLENQTDEELDMPMHVCIMGEDQERVASAVKQIAPLVDPLHADFEHERMRGLEQLAILSGTGKSFQERQLQLLESGGIEDLSYTKIEIKCQICGDRGHLASDCPNRAKSASLDEWRIDNEYSKLISQLGGKAPQSQPAIPSSLPSSMASIAPLKAPSSSHPLAMQTIPVVAPPPSAVIRKAQPYIPPSGFPPGFQ
jgi:splicing factor 1